MKNKKILLLIPVLILIFIIGKSISYYFQEFLVTNINFNIKQGVYAKLCDTNNDNVGDLLLLNNTPNFTCENYKIITNYNNVDNNTVQKAYNGKKPIWYDDNPTITKVRLLNKIKTTAGYYWFATAEKLTSIENLDKLDTSDVIEFNDMFYKCSSLTSLDVSHFNTSKAQVMFQMFDSAKNIKYLDVSNFNVEEVRSFAWMFSAMTSLKELDVSTWNTKNADNMRGMFAYQYENKNIVIGNNFKTSKVTNMNQMFRGDRELTNINLSNFDTSNVTDMSWMFYECYNLTSINLSSFNTSKVTNMSHMFDLTRKIESLDVSNFDVRMVTNFSWMFASNISLTRLDLSTWNTQSAVNMQGMFGYMQNVENIILSENFNTSKVTDISQMFRENKNITTLDLSMFDTAKVTDMWGMFKDAQKLSLLNVSSFNTSNVKNFGEMFCNTYSLEELNVSNFNTSSAEEMWGMFEGMINIKNINISHFNTSKVTAMQRMFFKDANLLELDVSNFNTSNVTNMHMMFENVKRVPVLDVSNWDVSKVTNVHRMFNCTSSLKKLDLSKWNLSNITGKQSAIFSNYCMEEDSWSEIDSQLEELYLPKAFIQQKVTNVNDMFSGLINIKSLDLSNWDTSNITDFYHIFSNMPNLETIYVGEKWSLNSWTASEPKDGDSFVMFATNNKLTGQMGTKYNPNYRTKEMAKVDELGSPGYLTFKAHNSVQGVYSKLCDTNNDNIGDLLLLNSTPEFTCGNYKLISNYDNVNSNTYTGGGGPAWVRAGTHKKITKVKILNKIEIDNSWGYFYEMEKLTEIENSLYLFSSSKNNTMAEMFYKCSSLKSLDLSNWNTSNIQTFSDMFAATTSLKTLIGYENWDVSKVWCMWWLFNGSGIEDINLSNWNTSSVTRTEGMFSTSKAKKITLGPNFTLNKVTDAHNMFYGLSNLSTPIDVQYLNFNSGISKNLESLFKGYPLTTIKNLDKLNVRNSKLSYIFENSLITDYSGVKNWDVTDSTVKAMFSSAKGKTILDISGWTGFNTVNATNHMFYNSNFTKIIFASNISQTKNTTTTHMFSKMQYLETIQYNKWTIGNNLTDTSYMFFGDINLKSVDVSAFNMTNVATIGHMFTGTPSLSMLDVSNWEFSEKLTNASFFASEWIEDDIYGLKTASGQSFINVSVGFDNLTEIKFGDGWKKATKLANMCDFISGRENLELLDLSWLDNRNVVVDMTHMLNNNPKITTVYGSPTIIADNIIGKLNINDPVIGGLGTIALSSTYTSQPMENQVTEHDYTNPYFRLDLHHQKGILTSKNKYFINYNLNGGSFNSNDDIWDMYFTEDNDYTLPIPSKVGKTFLGWTGGKNLFKPTLKITDTENVNVHSCTITLDGDEFSVTVTGTDPYFGYGKVFDTPGNNYDNETIGERWNLYELSGKSNKLSFYLTNPIFAKNFIGFYDENKNFINALRVDSNKSTVDIPEGAKYFGFRFGRVADGLGIGNTYKTKIMVAEVDEINEYEPYIMTPTLNITIPSNSKGNYMFSANYSK